MSKYLNNYVNLRKDANKITIQPVFIIEAFENKNILMIIIQITFNQIRSPNYLLFSSKWS